jgi:glycerophosphoryl diester phosphodiesterase
VAPKANLALLHHNNPFAFVAYHRFLGLSAVGFHRLHLNKLALEIAKRVGIFTYVYTVNRPKGALLLAEQGYDGIVTNYPDRVDQALTKSEA